MKGGTNKMHDSARLSVPGATPMSMHSLVIDVPPSAVSAELEAPIHQAERVRVYFGPGVELVLTPDTADALADALIDVQAWAADRPVIS
jgi:hypothetical protein